MGALGAVVLAVVKRKFSMDLNRQALDSTAKLASFVLFILIGSTVFSFTFNAADGHIWVEHLFTNMPGGAIGFLIVVNLLIFILGCFIDFFEIAFIVIPILAPVAEKILPAMVPGMTPDQAMIWFGVIVAMNLQTSFLTPPFGFALFYLRSVAPKNDYKDRVTGALIPSVKTTEIYKGSIAFIVLQLIMVAAVIMYPGMVTGGLDEGTKLDANEVMQQLENSSTAGEPDADDSLKPEDSGDESSQKSDDDALKALMASEPKK